MRKYCHRCGTLQAPGHKHRVKDRRPSPRSRGYNAEWDRTSRQFRAMFPICQWHEGCIKPSQHVHHLDGEGPSGPKGFDWGNLQALCHGHHSQINGEDYGFGSGNKE